MTVDKRYLDAAYIKGTGVLYHPVRTEATGNLDEIVVSKEDSFSHLVSNDLKVVLYEFLKGTIYPSISLKNTYKRK